MVRGELCNNYDGAKNDEAPKASTEMVLFSLICYPSDDAQLWGNIFSLFMPENMTLQ
jgi:hypothetical protein